MGLAATRTRGLSHTRINKLECLGITLSELEIISDVLGSYQLSVLTIIPLADWMSVTLVRSGVGSRTPRDLTMIFMSLMAFFSN
jgi:hypothetical protein